MRVLARLRARLSPSMVVAIVAVVFATTGSAFAARSLLTGADIKDGTITRADLSPSAAAAKGAHGARGPRGKRGVRGPEGPQGADGLIGPAGERGPAGATGADGPLGPHGATGAVGPQGPIGPDGPQGIPGQDLVSDLTSGLVDVGTPLALSSSGPAASEGADLLGNIDLTPGSYRIDVTAQFTDTSAPDPALEYGITRLFLDGSPLDGISRSPDTTSFTSDVPDDGNNAAQSSAEFIVNIGDNGSGGQTLNLRGAVRSGESDGATVNAHVLISHIG
jgi:hypothetical protein